MSILSKAGITTGQTVEPGHVTQSIDAFTGIEAYDISLSGSFNMTGSINGEPGVINNLTASHAISSSFSSTSSYALNAGSSFPYTGSAIVTGSLEVEGSFAIDPLSNNEYAIRITPGGSKTLVSSGNIVFIDFENRTIANSNASSNMLDFNDKDVLSLDNILQLTVRTDNPTSPAVGMIMVSGSGGTEAPYFYNGSSWVSMI